MWLRNEELRVQSADAGTFTGDGPVGQWRAPKDVKTPADYEVRLKVTKGAFR